jgi:hypothetical protein
MEISLKGYLDLQTEKHAKPVTYAIFAFGVYNYYTCHNSMVSENGSKQRDYSEPH